MRKVQLYEEQNVNKKCKERKSELRQLILLKAKIIHKYRLLGVALKMRKMNETCQFIGTEDSSYRGDNCHRLD